MKKKPEPVKRKYTRKIVASAETGTELFLKALGEAYPNDPTAPGLVIAFLRSTGEFYVSIKRYTEKWGLAGYTVLARKGKSLDEAYTLVKDAWIDQMNPKKSALNRLFGN